MKKLNINLLPWLGSALAILLYLLSLRYRGILTQNEYEFALMLKSYLPWLSGSYLPKLPAAIATLLTGGLLWLAAKKFRLLHPGTAAGLYLTFPPVWWFGTSASPAPVMAFLITVAAAGLFISRREKAISWKIGGFAAGLLGAIGSAFFAQSHFFSWAGVFLSFLPVVYLTFAFHLEKLDDQNKAAGKLNRTAVITAIFLLLILALFLAPPFCRIFKIDCPEALFMFQANSRLFRPAMALLIPCVWLIIAFKTRKTAEKIFFICFAVGFVLLALPPSIPWSHFAEVPQTEQLDLIISRLSGKNPRIFTDDTTFAAVSYTRNSVPTRVGRAKGDLLPANLAKEINGALNEQDVLVVSSRGELDSYLPTDAVPVKYTSRQNCHIFHFPAKNAAGNAEQKNNEAVTTPQKTTQTDKNPAGGNQKESPRQDKHNTQKTGEQK